MDLQMATLGDRSQALKTTYFLIHFYEVSRTGKSLGTESGLVVGGLGPRRNEEPQVMGTEW